MRYRLVQVLACVAYVALCGCVAPGPPVSTQSAARARRPAVTQQRSEWHFAGDDVWFTAQAPAARLSGVTRSAPDHYVVTIAPEHVPVNPSPWYGFAVRSGQPRELTLDFDYVHGRQRYWPTLSRDGKHWRRASDGRFTRKADGVWQLRVPINRAWLYIYAQRPVTSDDYARWRRSVARHVKIVRQDIGHSVRGRPIEMFSMGNPDAKRMILVIGRQHPPEVTGARALMRFVDTLASDTVLAHRFRRQVRIVVVPLMNPDGVAAGNWRDNAAGVDINRDWGLFTQPETRAVGDLLRRDTKRYTLAFAVDFHSTWSNVLYTVSKDSSRKPGGLLRHWIDAIQARFPNQIHEKANAARSSVFKNWVFHRYAVPALTYEVGDRTDPAEIRSMAHFAAEQLMRLMLRSGTQR